MKQCLMHKIKNACGDVLVCDAKYNPIQLYVHNFVHFMQMCIYTVDEQKFP